MPGDARKVFINRHALTATELQQLEGSYGFQIPDGGYWYDALCGAWGLESGPALGFGQPGLPLPGPMPADISGGGTGIFFNGRELHPQEQMILLTTFGTAVPGRYTLDAQSNLCMENGPFIVNLRAAMAPTKPHVTDSRYGLTYVDEEGAMFTPRENGIYVGK